MFVVEEQEHPRQGEAFMTIVGYDFHPDRPLVASNFET
jgi:hypothetical protein